MKLRYFFLMIISLLSIQCSFAQNEVYYEISFENAAHHEAQVSVTFPNLPEKVLQVRMPRTSPGRYALHEFAKNVYNVKAFDSEGVELKIYRPNPHQWNIAGHDGEVTLSYTLFGDRADGTYTGIDETHAHMNMPATFMFARGLENRPVKVKFNLRKDLNWKVATQLKKLQADTYYAPDLQYFMDSPTELSNFDLREWTVKSNGEEYKIRLAMHHNGQASELDEYTEWTKAIVQEQKAIFGELPDFDYGKYTFIACYLPHVNGDGMEHRNSTILTSTRPLATGAKRNIGTVSHEFFHCWNVERIRPAALEPFNFEMENMSGELWFAEGFTSYFDDLTLCRAGIISEKEYAEKLAGTLNYVLLFPGRQYFNPVEMSYQAPFVDAATSVDPVNRHNTFISYYSYGSVIGLVLDLQLRKQFEDKTLDGFMRYVWENYGEPENPYTVRDLENALEIYTEDAAFTKEFFHKHIWASELPDMEELLADYGIELSKAAEGKPSLGVSQFKEEDGKVTISGDVFVNSAAYEAGLDKGDVILALDGKQITSEENLRNIVEAYNPGDELSIKYLQRGREKTATLQLEETPWLRTTLIDKADKNVKKKREAWLKSNVKS
jgi:predicted metalloprotease with PDZ domain